MVAIRPMMPDDIDAVLKLAIETPEAPHWNRAVYERILRSNEGEPVSRMAWVAANGPDLLGFAVMHLIAGVCELESIVVAKAARRKGIGKTLLSAVTDWSLAGGAQKLELEVRADNHSAIAFYERAELIREGLRHRYYGDPEEDAVLMGKPLHSNG